MNLINWSDGWNNHYSQLRDENFMFVISYPMYDLSNYLAKVQKNGRPTPAVSNSISLNPLLSEQNHKTPTQMTIFKETNIKFVISVSYYVPWTIA
jgi:hypothetical protein